MFQAFLEQIERDARMQRLLESMNYTYDFVEAADALETIKARPAIIERLAQQTTECAYFIRDYAGQRSFEFLGSKMCTSLKIYSRPYIQEFREQHR